MNIMETGWNDYRENLVPREKPALITALWDPRIFQSNVCIYLAFACLEAMKELPWVTFYE
jgi:hypothetical protein